MNDTPKNHAVIPAQAGIQVVFQASFHALWVPASAGTTPSVHYVRYA